ncbi:hypothetical protein FRC02_003655 [Tulasnella sp. 418]|nr:hypothetical protein FRC02_003655 [Tulasnella sp. 418]
MKRCTFTDRIVADPSARRSVQFRDPRKDCSVRSTLFSSLQKAIWISRRDLQPLSLAHDDAAQTAPDMVIAYCFRNIWKMALRFSGMTLLVKENSKVF